MKPKDDFARFRKIAGIQEPITESIKKEKPKAKTLQSLFENKGSISRSEFNRLIKEHLEEAKKDEEEIVDTEVETTDEPILDEPIADAGSEVDGDVKTIQDHLEASIEVAKTMGDEKLITQLGNTLTMLTRSHIVKENEDEKEEGEPSETNMQFYMELGELIQKYNEMGLTNMEAIDTMDLIKDELSDTQL